MGEDAAIGLIILAAGGSSRLGRPKQLLKFEGQPLLRRTAETALAAGGRTVVVLGAEAEACAAALAGLPVRLVVNAGWKEGLAGSIRVGMEALEEAWPGVAGVILCVADQPLLSVAVLEALLEKQRRTGATMAACEYGGKLGVPAYFGAEKFGQLKALRNDEGARNVLRRNPEAVARVPFPGGEMDIDTPEDYRRIEKKLREGEGPREVK
jgi:molybdenum cofactor cytidylyltransferase